MESDRKVIRDWRGVHIKGFQDSQRPRPKYFLSFRNRLILFYIFNEATVVSAGMMNVK